MKSVFKMKCQPANIKYRILNIEGMIADEERTGSTEPETGNQKPGTSLLFVKVLERGHVDVIPAVNDVVVVLIGNV